MQVKTIGLLLFASIWGGMASAIGAQPLVDLPPKIEGLLTSLIQSEVEGWGSVDKTVPKVLKTVECYGGITMFSLSGIRYEIFPSLGFYRVGALQDASEWLLMDLAFKPEEAVVAKDNIFSADKHLNDLICACGSGILGKDISAAQLSCGRITHYRVLVISVLQNDGKVTLANILLDESNEVSAMSVGKNWKSSPRRR